MSIEKKTIVDQIEITRDGTIQLRLGLLLVEDGVEIGCTYHRTAIPPGTDPAAQLAAVDAHLTKMGKATLDTSEAKRVTDIAPVVHTLEAVSKYAQKVVESNLKVAAMIEATKPTPVVKPVKP